MNGLKFGSVVIGRHDDAPGRTGRVHCGLPAITSRRADRGCTAERQRHRPQHSEGRRAATILFSRCKAGRSMFVRLSGPDSGPGAAGNWTHAATAEYGDLLDVIRESCGLLDFRDVADEAVANLLKSRLAQFAAMGPPARGNKPSVGAPIIVHDLSLPSRPLRSLTFCADRKEFAITIETICRQPRLVEGIDLLRPDADQRLARYELVEDSPPETHWARVLA